MPVSRSEAVAIARTWIGTPYHLHARVKGAGADCATFLAEALIECGVMKREDIEDIGFYSADWFCHEKSERYLLRVMRHARKVAEVAGKPRSSQALPGCLALYRVGKTKIFNHGAFVTNWPMGIMARRDGVREKNLTHDRLTAASVMELFDPFGEP
jgi:hypothetical protein